MTIRQRSFADTFTFSRDSGATRVNAAGLIVGIDFSGSSNTATTGSKLVVLNSDVGVNRDWPVGTRIEMVAQAGITARLTGTVSSYTPSSSITITSGSATGTTVTLNFASQTNVIPVGSQITVNAVGGTGFSGTFTVVTSTATSLTYTTAVAPTGSVTGGTITYQLLILNITGVTGTGTATNWRVGNLEPRIDYDPATLQPKGILQEVGATAFLTQDNFLTPSSGGGRPPLGVSFSSNNLIENPEGNKKSLEIISNGATGRHYYYAVYNAGADRQGYASVFVKKIPNSGDFVFLMGSNVNDGLVFTDVIVDLDTLVVIKGNVILTPFTNGWARIQYAQSNIRIVGFGLLNKQLNEGLPTSGGVYLFGAEADNSLVVNAINRSYIPTTTVAVTRAADTFTASATTLNALRQGQGTIYLDMVFSQQTDTVRRAPFKIQSPTGEISINRQGFPTASFTRIVEAGSTQLIGSSIAATSLLKNTGKNYELATGTRRDTGATSVNLGLGGGISGLATSGSGFAATSGAYEFTYDGALTSATVRGVGGDSLNGSVWTGSRFVIANGNLRPVVSLDGQSYKVINTNGVITQSCNDVTGGLVGGTYRLVMVGNTGAIYTSDDQGETWTARTSGTTQNLNDVTFGSNGFVAVGNANTGVFSADGITYSAVSGLTGTLSGITHDGTRYIAINTVGGVFTSTNGTTFTSVTTSGITPAFTSAQGIAFGAGRYVIVGNNGQVAVSSNFTDYVTYTNATTPSTGTTAFFTDVLIFNGIFYAVGTVSNVTAYDPVNNTFTQRFSLSGFNFNTIAASTTTLLLCGNLGLFFSSPDGTTFTSRTNNNQTINAVAYGNNRYVSVGNVANGSGYIATIDPDGTVTRRVSGFTNGIGDVKYDLNSATYYLLTVNALTLPLYKSTDNGVTWSVEQNTGPSALNGNGGYRAFAVGNGIIAIENQNGGGIQIHTKLPGQTGFTARFNAGGACNAAHFANNLFVFVGVSGVNGFIATSSDGITFTQRTSGTTQSLTSVFYSQRDRLWYAAGGSVLLYSPDNAVTWYPVSGAPVAIIESGAQVQAYLPQPPIVDGLRNMYALSFKNNEFKFSVNGSKATVDTIGSIPEITSITFGDNNWIRNIGLYNTSLSDSNLQRVSLGGTVLNNTQQLETNISGELLEINSSGKTLDIN